MELSNIQGKAIFSAFVGNTIGNNNGKGHSIMDCRNEVILLWDNSSGCLLTQGLRSYCTNYQELHPTEPPGFEVSNLIVNSTGTKVALWGSSGICIIEMPWRCGPRLEYQDGKSKIIVKCKHLDLMNFGVGDEILQVRWDPSAQQDNILCILASDNSLYYMDCKSSRPTPYKILRVGHRPLSRHKTLSVLGDTAVDFTFVWVPSAADTEENTPQGIIVLRGNGDVCLTTTEKSNENNPEAQILPISPLADDNFLSEACSILVLPGRPPAVVIATARGVIYHSLLVPLDIDQVSVPAHLRLYRLIVVESVLLDPGLQIASDDINSYHIRLLRDDGHLRRYLAIHPSGVHSVVMEVLVGIQKLMKVTEENESSDLSHVTDLVDTMSSRKIPESILEYMLCTSRSLQGCVVVPGLLLAIDSDSNVVQLPMRCIELRPLQLFDGDDFLNTMPESPLMLEMRKPFRQQLEQLIQDSRVLPRMRFPPQDMPQDQLLEVVVRMANRVRKETIPRYRQIRSILSRRAHLIQAMQQLQAEELARLEEERIAITESAETFGERVQMVVEELEDQKNRVLRIVRGLAEVKPAPSEAERRMARIVGEIEKQVADYEKTLHRLKKDRAYQDMKIIEDIDDLEMALSSKQAEAIKSCLSVIGENISQVVRKVNEINSLLGLNSD